MKPIGTNTGLDASSALQPHGQEALPGRLPELKSRTRGTQSARIEDILASLPATSVTTATASPAPQLKRRVSCDFAEQLNHHVGLCDSPEDAQAAAASVLQQFATIDFVGWHKAGGERIGESESIEGLTTNFSDLSAQQQATVQSAVSGGPENAATYSRFSSELKATTVVARIRRLTGQSIVASFMTDSEEAAQDQLAAVKFAAGRLSEWHADLQREAAIRSSRHVAALVELIGKVASCQSVRAATQCLTGELQKYLGATEVSLGRCHDQQTKCHLAATSDVPDVNAFSDATRLVEAVLQESIARAATSIWPATEASNRHSLLSHQQFATEKRSTSVVSTPLRIVDGTSIGAIVATFEDSKKAADAVSFLFASERAIATSIASTTRATQTKFERLQSTFRRIAASGKLKVAAIVGAVVCAAMFIPMDYRVNCESELQPVFRRFVAAPFDAPLHECLVEPGDVVEANQLLAVLDGRELRWELAGLRADVAKATKEHNASLSEQKFGEAAIARHEIDRLQNQAELLKQRTQNLEIRSPIGGVIVAGDLKDTEGVPLETGQSLFEVAPLDEMVVELGIPEDDVRHVESGMTVELRLDANPSETITATIQRIHPRAELRDHENVFIAEAQLANNERQLRPGMRGDAKVSTGPRFLGWNLFHKPSTYLLGWLGW